MITIKKIQKLGYTVKYMTGNRNGMTSIIGVLLTKDNSFRKEFKNVTQALKFIS